MTLAMKFPLSSVRASLTCFAPSRNNDTSAPVSGFPLLSLTVPVMVASDLLGGAAWDRLAVNDTSAIQDKPRLNAFLMSLEPPRPPESLGSERGARQGKYCRSRPVHCQVTDEVNMGVLPRFLSSPGATLRSLPLPLRSC